MTLLKRSRLGMSALMLMAGLYAGAIPAKPGLIKYQQPDGTTVEIRIVGDEHFHLRLSPEGYPLTEDAGVLTYAEVSGDALRSTGIPLRAKVELSASERATIEKINLADVAAYFGRHAEANLPLRAGKRRMGATTDDTSRFLSTNFPAKGYQKGLVILVSYSDFDFTLDDPHDYFSRMMNEPGFSTRGATGSARDYFLESSDGQFDPEFDVYGPVKLPNTRAYYGDNNDVNAWEMVVDACEILKDEVDFSQYDRDNDGNIDNIYVFFAGEGESSSGLTYTVWPHSSNVALIDPSNPRIYNGKRLANYACSNEWEEGNPDGVGTFCHEFSHVMGLPDLYSTNYSQAFTPGAWSVLDYGPYNNEGRTPPVYTAFERYCMGWLQPEQITGKGNYMLPPVGSNNAFMLKASNDEFYLLENRQLTSWDNFIPYHGMLVWHIDFDQEAWDRNRVNNEVTHQRVDIVEADDIQHIDNREGDCFPGTAGVTSFTDDTEPSMKTWAGHRMSLPITEIAETSDGFITFKVLGGVAEQAAPASVNVKSVSSKSISVSWEAAAGATDYNVTACYSGTWLPVHSCQGVSTSGATEYTISGLNPSTSYNIYVTAKDADASSYPSPLLTVSTTEPGFEDEEPVALEATSINGESFVANWQSVEGATSYLLTVYTKEEGDPIADVCDFSAGTDNLPQGWSSSSSTSYLLASFAGESAPALRFDNDGDYIATGNYSDGVRSLSFWHRGSGTASSNNSLLVEGLVEDAWITLRSVDVVRTSGGATTEINDITDGCTAVRITYAAPSKAPLAIDDVVVGHGASLVRSILPAYDGKDAGDATSLKVEGLSELTQYYYVVKATDGTLLTGESNEIAVLTTDLDGIEAVEAGEQGMRVAVDGTAIRVTGANGRTVIVADVAGRVIASKEVSSNGTATLTVASGVYLLTDGNTTVKLIVK